LIIFLGFVAWALNGTPRHELQATRYMLAASLDRMVPSALGASRRADAQPAERDHPVHDFAESLAILALIAIPQAAPLGALMAQIIAYLNRCRSPGIPVPRTG
jgi:hypothetical protein